MQPEQVFQIATNIAMTGWLMVIIYPLWKHAGKVAAGIAVLLLSILYTGLVATNFNADDFKNFGSLAGVSTLFQNPWMLLAGWVHYLAFDLMMGLYVVSDARKQGFNHWLMVPVAFLCFMFGPVGLLIYAIFRMIKKRQLFDPYNP